MQINRHELVNRIAFERAEYEIEHADREAGWQPMVPFVKAATFKIARHNDVERVQRTESGNTVSFYARIDWKRLAADVRTRTDRFKRQITEYGAPV